MSNGGENRLPTRNANGEVVQAVDPRPGEPEATALEYGAVTLSERMAALLAPDLGEHTADVVSRHICAKFGVEDACDPDTLRRIGDFLRRGLVAYVGGDRARELAARCVTTTSLV